MKRPEIYRMFSEGRHGVSVDSRTIEKGDIFFALRGENYDGNRFVADALDKGAEAAVIDNPDYYIDGAIIVEDALSELQSLASTYRSKLSIPILAITGSNGKTTTRELVSAVLSVSRTVHSSSGNLNNHIGLPLTLLRTPPGAEMIVVEMGANHPGEIEELCKIAAPQYGIITNIGKAHLEGFGSFEGVLAAKSELYTYLADNHGLAFVNGEDETLINLVGETGVDSWYYDAARQGDITEVKWSCKPYLAISLMTGGKLYEVKTKLAGSYNVTNVLAAIGVGSYFGIKPNEIIKAIESYEPANNRSQLIQTGSNILIGDSYNANPASVRSSVSSFIESFSTPRMVILGDMLELGEYSASEHADLVNWLVELPDVDVLLTGDLFYTASDKKKINRFRTTGDLIEYLKVKHYKGYNILVKGSRKLKMETIYEYL